MFKKEFYVDMMASLTTIGVDQSNSSTVYLSLLDKVLTEDHEQ